MRILIDIGHPAHVHVFRHAMARLRAAGHDILVTSRVKECAVDLLEELQIPHQCLSEQNAGGPLGMLAELLARDFALARVARQFKPHVISGVGGIFAAHVGFALRIPSVVFYDTENATLQNLLTYPLATRVVVPDCYTAWTPRHKTVRYAGYHELAYLRPEHFQADRNLAIRNGLAAEGPTYLIRCVSWQANHDLGETGWSAALLTQLVDTLSRRGRVIISSEAHLPTHLDQYRYRGEVQHMHHVLAFCDLYIGESATMASEAAVLGVPAIYAAQTTRGYVQDLERRYHLVRDLPELTADVILSAVEQMLAQPRDHWREQHERLLETTVDVCDVITREITAVAPPA